nr:MAG TPA: hypothetical protein [Caudoviricetes sp.]
MFKSIVSLIRIKGLTQRIYAFSYCLQISTFARV